MQNLKQKQKNVSYAVHGRRLKNGNWKTQLGYYLMFIVPAVWVFVFSYLPMAGVYLAFTDYKPAKGIFGSQFVGLKHFKQFFSSPDVIRVFRNTILYNVGRLVLVSILCGIVFALLLYGYLLCPPVSQYRLICFSEHRRSRPSDVP